MPGRKLNPAPTRLNPRWKSISLPYWIPIIFKEYITKHPELGYHGVGDVVISILRESKVFREAEAEYLINHGKKHLEEDEIQPKIAEAEKYELWFNELIKRVEWEKAFIKYMKEQVP